MEAQTSSTSGSATGVAETRRPRSAQLEHEIAQYEAAALQQLCNIITALATSAPTGPPPKERVHALEPMVKVAKEKNDNELSETLAAKLAQARIF